jgi:uncharacterized protein YeeX (DUF496 family)
MDIDVFSSIVWATALIGVLISFCLSQWRRRQRTKRLLMKDLLKRYFQNDMPANELRSRIRKMGNYYFMRSSELFALVIAAFQGAVDEGLAHREDFKKSERKLLAQLAALKKELGLTDLYQIEGWRARRE